VSGGGAQPGWRLVDVSPGDEDGWHVLRVRATATARELVAAAASLPPSVLLDAQEIRPAGSGAVLWFRELPPGVVADSAPWPTSNRPTEAADPAAAPTVVPGRRVEGWVPTLGPATDAVHGLTPFDLAVWELLHAARHASAGAWIMTMVRLVPPEAVVALADLVREARGDGGARRR
jgi:hypothetical protein